MKTIPLYVYFPNEWENIKKCEENTPEGKKKLKYYSDIYKSNFLTKKQEDKKIFYADYISKQPLRAKILFM